MTVECTMSTKMVKIKQKLPLSGDNQNEKFEKKLTKKTLHRRSTRRY